MSQAVLLEGGDRERAERCVETIAESLEAELPVGLGLAEGRSGLALFFAYRWLSSRRVGDLRRAWRLMDEVIASLADATIGPGLFSGYTGIAWTLRHLAALDPSAAVDEAAFEEIDDALLAETERYAGGYDLVDGLAGLMLYGLVRAPNPSGARICEQLLLQAARLSESNAPGTRWCTPPDQLPAWQVELAPHGYYNLGAAHGAPGLLASLAQVYGAGLGGSAARKLFEGACAWLVPLATAGPLPSWVTAEGRPFGSRVAWCYGDLGAAAAFMCAARAARAPELMRLASSMARRAASASIEVSVGLEPGLCHGAIGNAHVFAQMARQSGDVSLREAARRWYRVGLDLLDPELPLAGVGRDVPETGTPRAHAGLLEGAAGVGLGLLAASTTLEPRWDQVFALSPIHREAATSAG